MIETHPAPAVEAGRAHCRSWHAEAPAEGASVARLATDQGESGDAQALDALRAMAALAWSGGSEATPLTWRAADDAARSALVRLGLPTG